MKKIRLFLLTIVYILTVSAYQLGAQPGKRPNMVVIFMHDIASGR